MASGRLWYWAERLVPLGKPSQEYSYKNFQGLRGPVLGAFLCTKRPWQQGMSHVHLCSGLRNRD
eukprot:1160485-Pelagomonas_calceolata.AAC.2